MAKLTVSNSDRILRLTERMKKHILFTKFVRQYQGSYIAVAKEKIVASGPSAKAAFETAQKILKSRRQKVEGVYYIPQKKDLVTALCVFRTCK